MKVEYTEETSVRKALSFEIEAEVVDREIEAKARDYARKAKIPGFRPGKIPAAVIKKRFRAQVLDDVAEALVNRVVFDELQGRGLRPLAPPRVSEVKIDESQPMTFRAVFETLPLVELPEYRGIAVKSRLPRVEEADVDREVDALRERAARYDAVEPRPVSTGDFVVLDLAWKPAGGGPTTRDENTMTEVGAPGNHAKLNEVLDGMSIGETRSVEIAAEAEDGAAAPGPGRDYTLLLKAIKRKVLPAADDEFAKDLGDFDTLQDLRERLRAQLVAAEERRIDQEVKSALIEDIAQKASFEVPEALVERHMSARTENFARGLAHQGIDPARLNIDWAQYRAAQREESVKAARAEILLDEISRRERIEALDADVDAEIGRVADRLDKSKEVLKLQMEKEGGLAELRARIRESKTLDLLKANARLDLE